MTAHMTRSRVLLVESSKAMLSRNLAPPRILRMIWRLPYLPRSEMRSKHLHKRGGPKVRLRQKHSYVRPLQPFSEPEMGGIERLARV